VLERDVERKLVKGVAALGGVAYKFTSPAHRGVADRLVLLPGGRVIFVELKTDKGVLSPLQKVFAADMQRLGQQYVCLYGPDDVAAFLLTLKESK
jgi:hypothetical protein